MTTLTEVMILYPFDKCENGKQNTLRTCIDALFFLAEQGKRLCFRSHFRIFNVDEERKGDDLICIYSKHQA